MSDLEESPAQQSSLRSRTFAADVISYPSVSPSSLSAVLDPPQRTLSPISSHDPLSGSPKQGANAEPSEEKKAKARSTSMTMIGWVTLPKVWRGFLISFRSRSDNMTQIEPDCTLLQGLLYCYRRCPVLTQYFKRPDNEGDGLHFYVDICNFPAFFRFLQLMQTPRCRKRERLFSSNSNHGSWVSRQYFSTNPSLAGKWLHEHDEDETPRHADCMKAQKSKTNKKYIFIALI